MTDDSFKITYPLPPKEMRGRKKIGYYLYLFIYINILIIIIITIYIINIIKIFNSRMSSPPPQGGAHIETVICHLSLIERRSACSNGRESPSKKISFFCENNLINPCIIQKIVVPLWCN